MPQDEELIDPAMDDIDPMPGDEDPLAMPEPEPQTELAPEEKRRLTEGLMLEDPELRDIYMAGMVARQQGMQQAQPQEPQYEIDPDFVGDPALEKLGAKMAMLEQALQRSEAARIQAEAQAVDARMIQALAAKTGADQETFADLLQVPGIGQAMQQFPALAGFFEKAAKAMSVKNADVQLKGKSIAPPPSVADGADFAGKAAVTARASDLKAKYGSVKGYKGYSDSDWSDMAKEEISMERKK